MPKTRHSTATRVSDWPWSEISCSTLDPIFTPGDTARLTGLDERQLWLLVQDGVFDPPIERYPGLPGFYLSSIDRWLKSRPPHGGFVSMTPAERDT